MTGDTGQKARGISNPVAIGLLLIFVIVVDVFAFLLFPPFDKEQPDSLTCEFPVCYINGNLEFPAPHAVWSLDGAPQSTDLITFQVSLSSTLDHDVHHHGPRDRAAVGAQPEARAEPGRRPERDRVRLRAARELRHLARRRRGPSPTSRCSRASSCSSCSATGAASIPPIGKIDQLRAPTSDLNVTIGLALVAFVFIEYQGFKHLGVGYLGKFFPFGEFRNGVGAGAIALFVGLTELLLEFVKPITLSMRLFGNIYGGEVALGVLTALTLAIIPMAMLALEVLLNAVQALIFATLTLMFTLVAIEGHGEEHEAAESAETTIHAVEAAAH